MTGLPGGFEDLEKYLPVWAHDDFQGRFDRRYTSDMTTIRAFYDAMLPHADAALQALTDQPLQSLSGSWLNLYKLLMALPHAALAVERHNQPHAANTSYPAAVRLVRGPVPA